MKTLSVCIVDNDIVKGFKTDKYANFIVRFFHRLGFLIQKVSVIKNSDDASLLIVPEIQNMLKCSDFIIISGDQGQSSQIFQAIATIFNVKLLNKQNGEISISDDVNCFNQNGGGHVLLPENATISKSVIKVENIYIFPGADLHVKTTLIEWQNHFLTVNNGLILYNRFLHVRCETTPSVIKLLITQCKEKYEGVQVNCQRNSENETQFKIILESVDLTTLLNCETYLKTAVKSSGHALEMICTYNSIYQLSNISHIVIDTIKVLEKCFTDYKLDEIFLSFNGGKDCTVLLYLAVVVLRKLYPENNRIQCVYIHSDNPFDELKEFINETVESYNLPLKIVQGNIRDALEYLLKCEPKYKAVLMGTRRSDPFSENLKHFQMTDKNWPQIMRVSPILEWDYADVWDFLRDLQIPYCSLYDLGYTSLGNKINTKFNEALKFQDKYLPAYLLTDGSLERDGRVNKKIAHNSR